MQPDIVVINAGENTDAQIEAVKDDVEETQEELEQLEESVSEVAETVAVIEEQQEDLQSWLKELNQTLPRMLATLTDKMGDLELKIQQVLSNSEAQLTPSDLQPEAMTTPETTMEPSSLSETEPHNESEDERPVVERPELTLSFAGRKIIKI